jgi:tetratricopeptide (TPR) repeat protein
VWQAFRNTHHADGFEVVTVGLDTAGPEACRRFIEMAEPEHPSLIDEHHRVAELFGVVNIPNAVWIDEDGMIVRPAEAAPAPPSLKHLSSNIFADLTDVPERMQEIMGEAMQIRSSPGAYEAALLDWIEHGPDSDYAMSPDQVIERSRPRSADSARGAAHFEIATYLEQQGEHEAAIEHFRAAHELVPDNFSYRRQAWSLEPSVDGPLNRFWQGPLEGQEADWPYDGEWLQDVRAMGPANYYQPWEA